MGKRWKDGQDEEVQIGADKVFRRNFGNSFKERYGIWIELGCFEGLNDLFWSFLSEINDLRYLDL